MFFGFDLKEILLFPVKDAEARKHFLVGMLVSLAAFVIPLIPYFILFGYAIRIVRQVLKNESPRMIPWDDWGGMFTDGARMFGVRIIYSLPLLLIFVPLIAASIALPFVMENSNGPEASPLFAFLMLIIVGLFFLLMPISIAVAIFVPAAEMHFVDNDQFAAGFRVREWWTIFRANTGGFIAAFAIYYLIAMVLGFAFQIIAATLIFACLMPILLPAMTIYLTLVMYVTIAQAYRDGKAKLLEKAPSI